MADLDHDNSVEMDGLLLGGDDDPYIVTEIDGWEESADYVIGSSDRSSDGVHAQRSRARDRQVRITLGIRTGHDVDGAVQALRVALAPPTDRSSTKLIRVRTRGVTKRGRYTTAAKPLAMVGDDTNLVYDHIDATATVWLPDPVIYSDAITSTAFSSAGTQTIVNAGTLAVLSPGAMAWTVTAGGGGCVRPFLRHADHPGEMWLLADVAPPGSVMTVDWSRITRRGGVVRSATVQGPNGCPVATWPVLRPGPNALEIGCLSGSVSAVVQHRSTW